MTTPVSRSHRSLIVVVLLVLAAVAAFVGAGGAFNWWNVNAAGFAYLGLGLFISGTLVSTWSW